MNQKQDIEQYKSQIERQCWNVRCQLGKVCKHAAPRQWQGLTEEEINQFRQWAHPDIIEAIELKLREKNT